jgi:diguanylate cyclase (GGDEF)-like protein/PAS domain S-box-containing protein
VPDHRQHPGALSQLALIEAMRLGSLQALRVLDTAEEPVFDRLARAAAALCGTPIALVSLVDAERQWFKARVGLPQTRETPRDWAFCDHAIQGDALFEVLDAAVDPRFADNPLVQGEPRIRYYAGVPLQLSDGSRPGTLCVIDRVPRRLDATQRAVLAELAAATAALLEQRQQVLEHDVSANARIDRELDRAQSLLSRLAASEAKFRVLSERSPLGVFHTDAGGRCTYTNARWQVIFGCSADEAYGTGWLATVHPDDRIVVAAAWETAAADAAAFDRVFRILRPDGDVRIVHSQAAPLPIDEQGGGFVGVVKDITERRAMEQRLRESEAFLERANRMGGLGSWMYEPHTGRQMWSSLVRRIHDLPEGETPPLDRYLEFYPPEVRATLSACFRGAVNEGVPYDLELPMVTASGRQIWVHTTGEADRDPDGRVQRVVGTFREITARKTLELKLASEHALLTVTLDAIGDAVLSTDLEGRVVLMNPAAERLLGTSDLAARGRPVEEVFSVRGELDREPLPNPARLCLERGEVIGPGEFALLVSPEGKEWVVEDSASPIRDASGRLIGVVMVFRDVSEQRRLSREMSHRAAHDALTGLVNRGEFERRLGQTLESAQLREESHALLFIDLDQFKLVNDACGHAVGDELLKQVSRLLGECVRSGDLLARLGGDEFGAILKHCRLDHAQRVAQQICERMEAFRFEHDGRRFRVGASIGLVPIERDWPDVATLLQAADTCCYAAKEAGRNRVHAWMNSDEAMLQRRDSMRWASRIESALDEDRFELWAQRIQPVLPQAGASTHLELLLRLREDGQCIAPGAFLPAAERFNLASRVDRWVLRRAFAWIEAHREAFAHIDTLAINLSGQSIGDRAFHRYVSQLLRESDFDLHRLCFEITETSAITALGDATAFISEMRRQGVRVALDDFGAGASSFGYLKQLPVDYIKVDGQFIRDLDRDPLNQATVRCFCQVAQVLGLATIAEFVDSERVFDALNALGVDYAQGYLLHRPEPLDALFPG